MAGTLTISTLSDGTNSTSSTNCIQGSARVWVNFTANGGTINKLKSYNVSSVTLVGTGIYTVNYTNALADTYGAVVSSCAPAYGSSLLQTSNYDNNSSAYVSSASAAYLVTKNSAGTLYNSYGVALAVFD